MSSKLLLLSLFSSILLIACNSSNQQAQDLTNASRDELVAFYDKLSDTKVKEIFVQQNQPQCVAEFQRNGVQGDVNNICNCIMNNMVGNMQMKDVRKMMLPSHMLNGAEVNDLSSMQMSAMATAIQQCK